MPTSSSSENRPKRMRIGTRSCSECRRRRVRCVFPPGQKICGECTLHDSPCRPQQPQPQNRPARDRPSCDSQIETDLNVYQKLQHLESLVRQIYKAVDLDVNAPIMAGLDENSRQAFVNLQSFLSPTGLAYQPGQACAYATHTPSVNMDNLGCFGDAPLLNLLKKAVRIETPIQAPSSSLETTGKGQKYVLIQELKSMIPDSHELILILQETEQFWPIWPLQLELPNQHDEKMLAAKSFILDSFIYANPTMVARSVLWFCLCVQQLPIHFKLKLPKPFLLPSDLIDYYLDSTENLLSNMNGADEGLEFLEFLSLQTKLYINMGRPRKAWLSIRRALNSALIQGLQRPGNWNNSRQNDLWSKIWQRERHLSMLLGFPSAISDSHPGLSREICESFEDKLCYDLSIISGHAGVMSEGSEAKDYSARIRIEQELQRWRNDIPQEWWEAIPTPNEPLASVYFQQFMRLMYYELLKMIHLPYMFVPSVDGKFEHSRLMTLEASRGMIESWQILRQHSRGMICDLMDFQVFSAAVVIALDLLSNSHYATSEQRHIDDWDLIHNLAKELEGVAAGMHCLVSGQASQLLSLLSKAYHGEYSSIVDFEAVIPYFGKVRIGSFKPIQTDLTATNTSHESSGLLMENVEFIPDLVFPYDQGLNAGFLFGDELGVDWTGGLDIDMEDPNMWNQVDGKPDN